MYNQIEKEFKKNELYRKNKLLFLFLVFFGVIVYFSLAVPYYKKDNVAMVFILEFLVIILFGILYYSVVFFVLLYKKEVKFKEFFHYDLNKNKFYEKLHNSDIDELKRILKENGINTRPKVKEIMKHYQALLPRKTIGGGNLLSILALTISVLAFIFSDNIIYSNGNFEAILIIFVIVSIFYYFIILVNKKLFTSFGEFELYKRLESSLTEIYIKQLIK